MPGDESRVHINAVTQSIDKGGEAKNDPSTTTMLIFSRSFKFVLIAVSHFLFSTFQMLHIAEFIHLFAFPFRADLVRSVGLDAQR